MKKIGYAMLLLAAAILVTAGGCGRDKDEPTTGQPVSDSTLKSELSQSVEEIRAKVESMDLEPLRRTAIKYRDALKEKQDDFSQVMEKLKNLSITEQMSEEAQGIRKELEQLTSDVSALQERFTMYVEAIAKKGGQVDDMTVE